MYEIQQIAKSNGKHNPIIMLISLYNGTTKFTLTPKISLIQ